MLILYVLAALWGGLCWRARGGGLTDATGWDPGTGGMRAIAAVAMAAPLVLLSWHAVVLIPALWIGWAIAGWGVFEGMGTTLIYNKPNPVASFLELLGIARGTVIHDLLGMAIEGVICLTPSMLTIAGMLFWARADPPAAASAGGSIAAALSIVRQSWAHVDQHALARGLGLLWAAGIAFGPAYLLAQRSPWTPNLGRFCPGTVRSAFGELLVGAIVLPALLGAAYP